MIALVQPLFRIDSIVFDGVVRKRSGLDIGNTTG